MSKYHHKHKDESKFNQLSVGPRYVFFQSLRNAQPPEFYGRIEAIGLNLVGQAEAILGVNPMGQYSTDNYQKIELYLTWLSDMASSEISNEKDFLQKTKERLKKEGKLSDILEKNFDTFFDNKGENLLQMQNLINEIMRLDQKNREDINKIYNTNMKLLSDKLEQIKKVDADLYKEYEQAFHTNPGKFNKMMNDLIKDSPEFKTSYANLVAQKVTSTIYNLTRNNDLISEITNIYTTNTKMTQKQLAQHLIAYITQEISNLDFNVLDSTTGKQLAEEIGNKLVQQKPQIDQIADKYIQTVLNATTQKSKQVIKTLEEIAITTGRETSRMFQELTAKEQQSFISLKNGYGKHLNKDEKSFLLEFGKGSKGQEAQTTKNFEKASKIINRAIRKEAAAKFGDDILKTCKEAIPDYVRSMFKIRNLKTGIKNYLRVRIAGPDMAEVLGTEEMRNLFIMHFNTPGKTMSYKNDITVYISFDDVGFANNLHVTMPSGRIPLLNDLPTNFLSEYKELSGGLTDVAAAKEAYVRTIEQQINVIEEAYKKNIINDEQKQKLLDSLHQSFFSGVSVKDYQFGTEQFGFHGGSLGSSIENIMKNVSEMYELGGISKADTEILAFAALNCGSDALGSHLKEPLQSYILGAAASIMFDEAFAASEAFLSKMKSRLQGEAPKTLHLFRMQGGKYITAGFIYQTIYNNLLSVYYDIQSTVEGMKNPPSGQVTINNIITEEGFKPNYKDMPSPQARWDAVSSAAHGSTNDINNIQINFSFMAGLLDVFEAIGKAFNV